MLEASEERPFGRPQLPRRVEVHKDGAVGPRLRWPRLGKNDNQCRRLEGRTLRDYRIEEVRRQGLQVARRKLSRAPAQYNNDVWLAADMRRSRCKLELEIEECQKL